MHPYGIGIEAKNDCVCLMQTRGSHAIPKDEFSIGLIVHQLLWRGQCQGFNHMLSLTLRGQRWSPDSGCGA